MSSRRTAKVAEAVREQVSTSILFELKDPRVKNVTVTRVEVSPDLRIAKIYVSVMGDEKAERLTMRGLESARGFLQSKVGDRLQIRYTPILRFELDQGIKRSIEASRLLRDVLPPSETQAPETQAPESHADTPADETASDDEERDRFDAQSGSPAADADDLEARPPRSPESDPGSAGRGD
jgi:ribosome-binding factor A